MKKLLTLTLSLLMALSLCLTISAEDNGSNYFKIGDNEYSSLKAALNAVRTSTETDLEIDLIASREEDGEVGSAAFEIPSGKNIVLDLNGYTLTLKYHNIACYGNLTINGGPNEDGKIVFDGHNSSSSFRISVKNGATFTLQSGKIISQNNSYDSATIYAGVSNGSAGKVIINGGFIESSDNVACIEAKNSGATAEVNGGTFKGSNIFVEKDGGKITVSSGTFSSDVSAYLASDSTIVKYNNEYTVYSANDTVSVDEDTKALAGLSSAARTKLDAAGTANTIKDKDGNSVTVNSSTQLVLDAANISTLEDDKLNKIVEKTGTEISNLSLLPLNITLTAKTGDDTKTITDLGEGVAMPVTLYLSDDVVSSLSGKTIKVVRFHGDDVDALYATLNGKVLTFESGKFSTFVICGITSSSGGNTDSDTNTNTNTNTNTSTKSYDAKDKNKDGVVSCEEEMNSANWIWSTSKQACVYKVTNTSVK